MSHSTSPVEGRLEYRTEVVTYSGTSLVEAMDGMRLTSEPGWRLHHSAILEKHTERFPSGGDYVTEAFVVMLYVWERATH